MLSLDNAIELSNSEQQPLFHQLSKSFKNRNNNMSAKAKQTAVNQAAQISMNRGQFQPFYYYTANNANGVNGQTVQLHSYPGMAMPGMQGMQGNMFAHPQFAAYNAANGAYFYAAQQAQAMQQSAPTPSNEYLATHRNSNSGLLATPTGLKSMLTSIQSKNNQKAAQAQNGKDQKPTKKSKVTLQNSKDSEESSDHGINLNSKTESGSENGTHSCDMDKSHSEMAPLKKVVQVPATTTKPRKEKSRKPVKKVICVDLPEDLQTIETVTNRCQQYGEILLVRVLKPGKVMPFDLKMYSGKIHDLGRTVCAIVEFESPAAASAAVEGEDGTVRLALLQQGADIALYGAPASKATSEHSSEHTHGESGIDINRSRSELNAGSSHRDSLSNHSHDDFDIHNVNAACEFVEDTTSREKTTRKLSVIEQKVSIKVVQPVTSTPARAVKLVTPTTSAVNTNIFRPSFLATKKTIEPVQKPIQPLVGGGLLATPPKEFAIHLSEDTVEEPEEIIQLKTVVNESKVIATSNGRITTALNIKLCAAKPNIINRNAIKMNLTNNRFIPKIVNFNASEILPEVRSVVGRTSPALLSDPSDDFLMQVRFSEDNHIEEAEHKQYSRDVLFGLRECKRALQLPNGLPNIPELLPTAKQIVLPAAAPEKASKYFNNQHHNNHFNMVVKA